MPCSSRLPVRFQTLGRIWAHGASIHFITRAELGRTTRKHPRREDAVLLKSCIAPSSSGLLGPLVGSGPFWYLLRFWGLLGRKLNSYVSDMLFYFRFWQHVQKQSIGQQRPEVGVTVVAEARLAGLPLLKMVPHMEGNRSGLTHT
jgi:hypothetical protein